MLLNSSLFDGKTMVKMPIKLIGIFSAYLFISGCTPVETTRHNTEGFPEIRGSSLNYPLLPFVHITKETAIDTSVDLTDAPNYDAQREPTQLLKPIKSRGPYFPEEARRKGYEGVVVIDFLVNSEGKVIKAVINNSDHEVFNYYALYAIMQWEFIILKDIPESRYYWSRTKFNFRFNSK